jgi:hypothetical protein
MTNILIVFALHFAEKYNTIVIHVVFSDDIRCIENKVYVNYNDNEIVNNEKFNYNWRQVVFIRFINTTIMMRNDMCERNH